MRKDASDGRVLSKTSCTTCCIGMLWETTWMENQVTINRGMKCDKILTGDICDKCWMQQTGYTLLRKLFTVPAASHEKVLWHKDASSARQGCWGTQVDESSLLPGCENEVTGFAYRKTTLMSEKSSPTALAAAIAWLFKA